VTIDVNRSPEGGTITRNLARGDPPLMLRATDLAFDQEPLTITALSGNPGWVNLLPPGTGGNTLGETVVSAAPSASTPSGVYNFTATVEDPGGLSATAHINLTITNLAPTAVADQFSTEESSISFDPTANDFDPEGDLLCVQTVGNPDNGSTVSLPDVSCAKSINFNLVHGETRVTYTVRDDPGGLTSSSTITIISNRPPTLPDATGATNGEPTVDITLKPTEPDGDRLSPVTCNSPADGDGPNANFRIVSITFNPNGGTDPVTHPQFDVIVSIEQPFTPGGPDAEFHCTVTDPFGKKAVGTVRITFN
jgi:hypothetical protein